MKKPKRKKKRNRKKKEIKIRKPIAPPSRRHKSLRDYDRKKDREIPDD